MSSLKNAIKTQKTHRERHQPQARDGLGLLEKRKDYRQRAKDFNEKKRTLLRLRKKALNKNPDEFYHHMINSQTVDGIHREKAKEETVTPEQVRLMQTRDLTYIVHKRTVEKRKIEKLQSCLHVLDAEDKPRNKHTFFVDSDREKKSFDLAKRLGTDPALVDRVYNRPRVEDLRARPLGLSLPDGGEEEEAALLKRRQKAYKELQQRIEREKQLGVVQAKMEAKRNLQGKEKPLKIMQAETKTSAAIMKWPTERKK